MVPVGARSSVEAVTVRHEESAVAAGFGTALGSVAIPAGTGPTEPQCARGQRVSIVQDGGFALSISGSLYASEETFKLLSFLSGWGWRADGFFLAVGMDG